MATAPRYEYTVEGYLAFERRREGKSEFFAGDIFLMAGASEAHVLIAANVAGELRSRLKGRPCKAYPSDMRLKVSATGLYTYPDVMVVCGEVRFADAEFDMIENPQVIVEVLSPSTEKFDREAKFEHYKTIGSLTDYILIRQDARRIEHHVREDNGRWSRDEVTGLGAVLRLPSIDCELPLDEIYDKIELTA